MLNYIRYVGKSILVPLLYYRYAPFGLAPERLAIYISSLIEKADVPGDVAEVGCNLGGTAVIASKVVEKYSKRKSYICYDTFGGFVDRSIRNRRGS